MYTWTCKQEETDCTSLLSAGNQAYLVIPGNSLVEDSEYEIRLTISKDDRSESDTIFVKTVDFGIPTITFS